MRHFTLEGSPRKPVSHDPSLIKSLIVDESILPGIKSISRIVLPSGSRVEEHVHDKGYEVFYIIRGKAAAIAGNERLEIAPGHCLIVEPGDPHGFDDIRQDTEMLYFFLEDTR